jgi:hypothetical protein
MVAGLPGIEEFGANVDPAVLACPRVPTGESNGGTAGVVVELGDGEAVVELVAVELTVVGAVVEGVDVEVAKDVTGGLTFGAAVVPKAGVEAAVEAAVGA